LVTAFRLVRQGEEEVHPEQNPVLRLVRRVIPSTTEYNGQHMFVRHGRKLLATPLLAVLIVIETSDVVFAVDSIPAILAVSREQFIVFSSNAFAILGLRALYFLLADLRDRFRYLQEGLAVILAFVGIKMIIAEWYHIDTFISLGFIALVLTISIWLSMRKNALDELAQARRAEPASGEGRRTEGNGADRLGASPDAPAEATRKPGAPS
jgi:tellurite resistance protein TerC